MSPATKLLFRMKVRAKIRPSSGSKTGFVRCWGYDEGLLKQEDGCKLLASLGYVVRPCLKHQTVGKATMDTYEHS